MKTVTMAAWYFSVACGNLLIIVVTQMLTFNSQVSSKSVAKSLLMLFYKVAEFLFFAVLLGFDLILFKWISMHYHFRTSDFDESHTSILDGDESCPLLAMPSH